MSDLYIVLAYVIVYAAMCAAAAVYEEITLDEVDWHATRFVLLFWPIVVPTAFAFGILVLISEVFVFLARKSINFIRGLTE